MGNSESKTNITLIEFGGIERFIDVLINGIRQKDVRFIYDTEAYEFVLTEYFEYDFENLWRIAHLDDYSKILESLIIQENCHIERLEY